MHVTALRRALALLVAALVLGLCCGSAAHGADRPGPSPGVTVGPLQDVPTCLRELAPGEACPASLTVPPSRTGPVVAAAAAVVLTGSGVLAAGLGALLRRLRISRRGAARPPGRVRRG